MKHLQNKESKQSKYALIYHEPHTFYSTQKKDTDIYEALLTFLFERLLGDKDFSCNFIIFAI